MLGIRDLGLCRERSVERFGIRLFGLALVLVVAGYFGPWIPHETAALTVTGFELAEFAKFFPQVQGGVVPVHCALFYLPLVVAFILLALFAGRSSARPVRLGLPLFAAVLLLVMLLPYTIVNGARLALTTRTPFTPDPQYTGQLALVVVGSVLMLFTPLASRLPRRTQFALVALLAIVGIGPALYQFALLRPLIVALYDQPLGLGWGLIVCTAGFALLLLSGALVAAGLEHSVHERPSL